MASGSHGGLHLPCDEEGAVHHDGHGPGSDLHGMGAVPVGLLEDTRRFCGGRGRASNRQAGTSPSTIKTLMLDIYCMDITFIYVPLINKKPLLNGFVILCMSFY